MLDEMSLPEIKSWNPMFTMLLEPVIDKDATAVEKKNWDEQRLCELFGLSTYVSLT
jgi:hypothetical protein